jgi:hypothetical protein
MDTPDDRDVGRFAPILDAVTRLRAELAPRAVELAAAIRGGDRDALAEAEQINRACSNLVAELDAIADPPVEGTIDGELDPAVVQRIVGIDSMVEAVLVAYGEWPTDDDEMWQRWQPLRLERRRAQLEHWVDNLDAQEASGSLDPLGVELRADCRGKLALIAAGIEPDADD